MVQGQETVGDLHYKDCYGCIRTVTAANIGVEMIRRVEEIIRVAIISSNLKRTYIRILKEAVGIEAVGAR